MKAAKWHHLSLVVLALYTTRLHARDFVAFDGCPNQGSNPDPECLPIEGDGAEIAATRCCSDNDADLCESFCQNGLVSYRDAAAKCADEGLRLCAPHELANRRCCGAGCSFDGQLVWTSRECRQATTEEIFTVALGVPYPGEEHAGVLSDPNGATFHVYDDRSIIADVSFEVDTVYVMPEVGLSTVQLAELEVSSMTQDVVSGTIRDDFHAIVHRTHVVPRSDAERPDPYDVVYVVDYVETLAKANERASAYSDSFSVDVLAGPEAAAAAAVSLRDDSFPADPACVDDCSAEYNSLDYIDCLSTYNDCSDRCYDRFEISFWCALSPACVYTRQRQRLFCLVRCYEDFHLCNPYNYLSGCIDDCPRDFCGHEFDNEDACLNGGVCSNHDGGFECSCAAGWKGKRCTKDVNDCIPNPCANGGTCTDTGTNSFQCSCPPAWTGDTCSDDDDDCASVDCQNDALCIDTGTNSYECVCADGFSGNLCQDCASPIIESASNVLIENADFLLPNFDDIAPHNRAQLLDADGNNVTAGGSDLLGFVNVGALEWSCPIGYVFGSSFTDHDLEAIRWGLAHVSSVTHWQFRMLTAVEAGREPHIEFKAGAKSLAPVGRSGNGAHTIQLRGGTNGGEVAHEILHVLGLYHEHSRPDRADLYDITIAGSAQGDPNYAIISTGNEDRVGRFDLGSTMMYPGLPDDMSANGWSSQFKNLRYDYDSARRDGICTLGPRDYLTRRDAVASMRMFNKFSTNECAPHIQRGRVQSAAPPHAACESDEDIEVCGGVNFAVMGLYRSMGNGTYRKDEIGVGPLYYYKDTSVPYEFVSPVPPPASFQDAFAQKLAYNTGQCWYERSVLSGNQVRFHAAKISTRSCSSQCTHMLRGFRSLGYGTKPVGLRSNPSFANKQYAKRGMRFRNDAVNFVPDVSMLGVYAGQSRAFRVSLRHWSSDPAQIYEVTAVEQVHGVEGQWVWREVQSYEPSASNVARGIPYLLHGHTYEIIVETLTAGHSQFPRVQLSGGIDQQFAHITPVGCEASVPNCEPTTMSGDLFVGLLDMCYTPAPAATACADRGHELYDAFKRASCCTELRPCYEGNGGCTTDSQCHDHLVCSASASDPQCDGHRCCVPDPTPPTPPPTPAPQDICELMEIDGDDYELVEMTLGSFGFESVEGFDVEAICNEDGEQVFNGDSRPSGGGSSGSILGTIGSIANAVGVAGAKAVAIIFAIAVPRTSEESGKDYPLITEDCEVTVKVDGDIVWSGGPGDSAPNLEVTVEQNVRITERGDCAFSGDIEYVEPVEPRPVIPVPTYGPTFPPSGPLICGNCLEHRPGERGCEVPAVQLCVCAVDFWCCSPHPSGKWDHLCVSYVTNECGFGCIDAPPPTPLPTADDSVGLVCGDCLTARNDNSPGCEVDEIQACVCGRDPFCCQTHIDAEGDTGTWDATCVARVTNGPNDFVDGCGFQCDPDATTAPTVAPTDGPAVYCGDCLEDSLEFSGCEAAEVEQCVCDLDPWCCGESPLPDGGSQGYWDELCVRRVTNSPHDNNLRGCAFQCLQSHVILDGCSTKGASVSEDCADADAVVAGTRCCGDGSDECESWCPNGKGDDSFVTLQEAIEECASRDLRLCTRAELEGGKCCSKKCGFDSTHVWADESC